MKKTLNKTKNKLRVIIVDGIDKSGKSTFIDLLSKEYRGILMKITDRPLDSSEKERNKIKNYYSLILGIIMQNPHELFILDRFIWSEMAYSFKRGYEAINDPWLLETEKILSILPHLMIHLSPLEEIIRYRLEQEEDEHINQDDVSDLFKRYQTIFDRSPLNKIQVDSSQDGEKMLKIIKNKLNKNEHSGYIKRQLKQLQFDFR